MECGASTLGGGRGINDKLATVNAPAAILGVLALAAFLLFAVQPLFTRWYRAIEPGLPQAMHGRGGWYTGFLRVFVVAFCAGLLVSVLLETIVPVLVATLVPLLV